MKYFNDSLKQMRKLILLISAIIVLFGFLPNHATAFKCDVSPDPWFSFLIDFDKNTLPPGVEFITKNEYVTGYEYGKFSLKNNGGIPLYLIEVPDPSKPVYSYPNSELPQLVIPRHRLVDGKAYYYTRYPFEYRQNAGGIDNSAAYEVNITQEELGRMGVKVVDVHEDDRSALTTPPPVQNLSIKAYHGKQPIEIKGEISYAFNKDYDPKAGVKKKASCDKALKTWEKEQVVYSVVPLLRAFPLLTLPILGLILVYRLIKRKSIKKILIIFLAAVLFNIMIHGVWFLVFPVF